MTRYVIGPDVAIRLARDQAVIRGGHQILAPALLRLQVLSLLYQAVRRGEMTRKEAERQLEYVRGLRIRLLGDRVLQNVAWKAAVVLGWPDTFDAEYVALTQLHADALITLDRQLADAAPRSPGWPGSPSLPGGRMRMVVHPDPRGISRAKRAQSSYDATRACPDPATIPPQSVGVGTDRR
jgi:predicted nucleic acid-binding protein